MSRIQWVSSAIAAVAALSTALSGSASAQPKNEAALLDTFEKKVRPILANNCYNCHSASTKASAGLRVDDRNGLLTGGNRGAAVVPGDPTKSLLVQAINHSHQKVKMPPGKKLDDEDIAVLTQWVKDGAVWPRETLPASVGRYAAKYADLKKTHWAFQPLRDPKAPAVTNEAWVRDEIDRFILAGLEAKKLSPVKDADRASLLRRLTFDLTGLPPTPAELDAFVLDETTDALAQVVDRLLASPAFGERWGRHWLDVARYGESSGSSRNLPTPHAWRYRDYVIDAFNKDKPYDQFIREQIAGDLLPASSPEQKDEQTTATGFLALGVKDVNQRFKVRFIMDNVDEQIDTVTRSVLALTASCARCHDHKFDPIPTHDYYALAGIFTSTDNCSGLKNKMGGGGLDYYEPSLLIPLSAAVPTETDPEKVASLKAAYEKAKSEWDAIRGTPKGTAKGPDGKNVQVAYRIRFQAAQTAYFSLTDPAAKGLAVMGARDAKKVADTEIRIRGEAEKLGPTVPRGFLSLIDVPGAAPVNPEQSGRLQLAQWLTHEKNPLTPRVAVNRVWHHLFGRGIVSSVDNFGINGDTPANPELLDHLATRFTQDGWSVKKLIRTIVLSHAYQLSNESTPEHLTADPANKLIWRHSPRRLEAEEIRDATLAIAGVLATGRPKGSPAQELKVVEMRNNGPEARKIDEAASASLHRSVYLPLVRGLVPRSLEVFDFAEQGMVTGQRDATTVPPQALYLLNDPFVRRQSLAFAERLLKSPGSETSRIQLAYLTTLGREASPAELKRVAAFLGEYEKVATATVQPVVQSKSLDTTPTPKQPEPANPDEIDQTDTPVNEEAIVIADPRVAAWTAFTQSLLASAEFRFVK